MRASIFVFLIVASIQTVAAQDATGPVIPDERQIGEATKQLTAKLINSGWRRLDLWILGYRP